MNLVVTEDLLEDIQIGVTDEGEEIAQNVAVLLASPVGSIPLERGMGLSMRHLDKPGSVVQAILESELDGVLDEYESRATVQSIATTVEEGVGTASVTVEVNFNGG